MSYNRRATVTKKPHNMTGAELPPSLILPESRRLDKRNLPRVSHLKPQKLLAVNFVRKCTGEFVKPYTV